MTPPTLPLHLKKERGKTKGEEEEAIGHLK